MYKVALIADNHFFKTQDGHYYVNGTYTTQYLKRFTDNFDELLVVARVTPCSNDSVSNLRESGGERVSFFEIKDFSGVSEFLKNKSVIKKALLKAFSNVDAVFIRMPCILTTISIKCAKKLNKPIMLDVGADPNTIYRSNPTTIIERLLSSYMKNVCKKACRDANGVSYVTNQILQNKYPCAAIRHGESIDYFTASISNVDIPQSFYYSLRKYDEICNNKQIRLLHISNNITSKSSKGHFEAIEVLEKIVSRGLDALLTFVGDGEGISSLKQIALKKHLEDRVFFTGRIGSRDEYRKVILENDLFVFPSHSEGLPRVLLEVMSTGMVCVASDVDGIPEILNSTEIFDYKNIDGFANRIIELLSNFEQMNSISKANYAVSLNYSRENIKKEFDEYCYKVMRLIDNRRHHYESASNRR